MGENILNIVYDMQVKPRRPKADMGSRWICPALSESRARHVVYFVGQHINIGRI